MQEFKAQLDLFMRQRHLSQRAVAEAAGVDQATVSRVLRGVVRRQGRAESKLFKFLERELRVGSGHGKGRQKVVNAFDGVWDGSEAHALAIAKIISASKGLLPAKRSGVKR